MWFKNASLLRLPADFSLPTELDETLQTQALRSPGPLELETRGFLSPIADGAALSHASGGAVLLHLGSESRLLPSSVVRDALDDKFADHEARTGRKPGKRLRAELRDAVLGELLPRAFIQRSRTPGYFDPVTRMLVVDSSSDKAAETFASVLREALGSFPSRPLAAEASLPLLMTEWLIAGEVPEGFTLGDECELKDPSDNTSQIKCKRHDLGADEVREHARVGKQVTQLSLVFDDRISFVLDAKLKLRKLKFLDIVADQLDAQDGADQASVLDAEFTLMSLELRRLLERLNGILRFVE
jgi:recombination associated protein RdgC